MTNTALNEFFPSINSLGWVEVYGAATKLVHSYSHKNNNGLIKFPVTTSINEADCWDENSIYKKLIPDDQKTSLLYFEEIEPYKYSSDKIKGEVFTAPIKMVLWINIPKLGLTHTTTKIDFINSLKNIFGTRTIQTGGKVSLNLLSVDNKVTTHQYFNKYNYNNVESLLHYPYLPITINCEIKIYNCATDLTIGTPVDCQNLAYD